MANYAYINTHDELLRETFENDGIPQTVFIKNGKTYYMPWAAIGYNRMLEFMIRYDYLKVDALEELQPIPTKITIYIEYYKKHIGWGARKVESFIKMRIKPWWEKRDPELKHWPQKLMDSMKVNYFDPHPKTSGKRIIQQIFIPFFLITLSFLFCCCHCCCRRKNTKIKSD